MVERIEADKTEQKPLKGEKQYREFLLQSLGVSSLLLALLICYLASLPMTLAEEISFTAEEVESFAVPGARLMARANIPDKVRNGLVNSGDYVGLGTAAIAYIYRILYTLREVRGDNGSTRQAQSVPTPTTNAQFNGHTGGQPASVASGLASWGNFTAG